MLIPMKFECSACGWTEARSPCPSRCPSCGGAMETNDTAPMDRPESIEEESAYAENT